MRALSLLVVGVLSTLSLSVEAQTKATFMERAKVHLAPVRVRVKGQTLSVVHLGIMDKKPMVKSIKMQLPNGTQVQKDFGYKIVGDQKYRSVLTTKVKPDGSASYRLNIKGLATRSWTGTDSYSRMTKLGSRTAAVFRSPVTQSAIGIGTSALLAPSLVGAGLLNLYWQTMVAGANGSTVSPKVQNLNQ